MIGRYCMVRTRSAGVFAGTVAERDGAEVLLKNARRIWYGDGAATLSQLATKGTSNPNNCKFPAPVAEVVLLEVIEIIPITDAAAASIAKVPVWSYDDGDGAGDGAVAGAVAGAGPSYGYGYG